MNIKKMKIKIKFWVLLFLLSLATSCKDKGYSVSKIEGEMIPVDSLLDSQLNPLLAEELEVYSKGVDSMMSEVIGESALFMDVKRPESLLSNLIADILREAGEQELGVPADIGLVNIGGIRTTLNKGIITMGDAFEILPFENSLAILFMKGSSIRLLMEDIAKVNGEGVSNINLVVNQDLTIEKALVGGLPIDDEKVYTLATLDYLSEGNDGMHALLQAEDIIFPEDATLRDLFVRYVKQQHKNGNLVNSTLSNRIIFK